MLITDKLVAVRGAEPFPVRGTESRSRYRRAV